MVSRAVAGVDLPRIESPEVGKCGEPRVVKALPILRRKFATFTHRQYFVSSVVVSLLFFLLSPALSQNSSHSAITIEGKVRNSSGEPIAGVSVSLEEKSHLQKVEYKSNADGIFVLSVSHAGIYVLKAQKSGWRDAVRENLELSAPKMEVDLVLENLGASPASAAPAMEFKDEPNFTVAGVTDGAQAGGHGSDAGLRASETLAREAVVLNSGGANEASDRFLTEDIAGRKPTASENELRAALVRMPGGFDANRRLGEFYFLSGKYREALPLFEAAYQIDPANFANGYDLALVYRANGDFAKARAHTQKMLTQADRAELHALLGNLNEQLGDSLTAVREYEQAVQMNPSEQNYFEWGTELLLHRAVAPATEIFAKGANAHPDSVRMLVGQGTALYAGGFYDQAASRLCVASDLKPSDSTPYLFLGKMEETAPAPLPCVEEKMARFIQNQPGDALAHYYYAMSLLKRAKESGNPAIGKPAEALLERAASIDPKLGEAYLQLGILYFERGDYARAIRAYQKAIEVSPKLGSAHYRLALAFKRVGEDAKAQQEFQTHQQIEKTEAADVEHQRREIQQFLIVLKDQPPSTQKK